MVPLYNLSVKDNFGQTTSMLTKVVFVYTCCSVNLQEELDMLRVQTSQDAATIHELRSCLEQEKQGGLCHQQSFSIKLCSKPTFLRI